MNNDKLEAEWLESIIPLVNNHVAQFDCQIDRTWAQYSFRDGYFSAKKSSQADIERLSVDLKISQEAHLLASKEIQKLTLQLEKAEEVLTEISHSTAS